MDADPDRVKTLLASALRGEPPMCQTPAFWVARGRRRLRLRRAGILAGAALGVAGVLVVSATIVGGPAHRRGNATAADHIWPTAARGQTGCVDPQHLVTMTTSCPTSLERDGTQLIQQSASDGSREVAARRKDGTTVVVAETLFGSNAIGSTGLLDSALATIAQLPILNAQW